jgi:uncharacterized DUF497 family protein
MHSARTVATSGRLSCAPPVGYNEAMRLEWDERKNQANIRKHGLVLCHSFILGYTDFSLHWASSIFICQSTPRWVLLTSSDHARIRC